MEEIKEPVKRKRRIQVITWKPQRTFRLIHGELVPVDVFRSKGLLKIRRASRKIRGPKSHCMSCSNLKVVGNGFSFNNDSRDKFICWSCFGKLVDALRAVNLAEELKSGSAIQTADSVKKSEGDKNGVKSQNP